jgi:6-phosphogluconolactonase
MTAISDAKIEVLENADLLARAAAAWLLAIVQEKRGIVAIALSGGITPRGLYECLGSPPYLLEFPWSRTHWFWGDERFVPHDDVRSNFHMVWKAMLARAPVPAGNIHAIATEGTDSELSAAAYERELKAFYAANELDAARELFDVVLLGLGTDGHTASLLPGTSVLKERNRWVCAVEGAKCEKRITLTYPALNSARHVGLLVSGVAKQSVFASLRQGQRELPVAHICPSGELRLFADAAAAPAARL